MSADLNADPEALARHDALLTAAVEAHREHLVKTTGDGLGNFEDLPGATRLS